MRKLLIFWIPQFYFGNIAVIYYNKYLYAMGHPQSTVSMISHKFSIAELIAAF